MESKTIVVNLRFSRQHGRAALLGLGTMALLLGTTAVASVPATFEPGDVLSAADLNANFSALDDRVATVESAPAPPIITEWQPYEPVVSAGGTELTAVPEVDPDAAYWRRVGDTLEVRISMLIMGCSGVSGQIHWSLPEDLVIDADKGTTDTGSGIIFSTTAFTTRSIATSLAGDHVSIDTPPSAGGVFCSQVEDGDAFRFGFKAPIEGWGVSDG